MTKPRVRARVSLKHGIVMLPCAELNALKAKSAAKKRGPTVASLRAKVERAAREGNNGPSLGAMSYAERDKVLFGLL